jgi:FAD/FMN-containing dehydrogenase
VQTPFVPLPQGKHVVLFALQRNAVPATAENVQRLLDANTELFDKARTWGGKRYAVGSVPMIRGDWPRQLKPFWDQFAAAKQRFDPANILTPGQRIFG